MNVLNVVEYRHNPMDVRSLGSFLNVKGGLNQNRRDVYFVRLVGSFPNEIAQLQELEKALTAKNSSHFYMRMGQLPKLASVEDVDYYSKCYDEWQKNGCQSLEIRCTNGNEIHKITAGSALKRITDLYQQSKPHTVTMTRNFAIKLLYWYDATRKDAGAEWTPRNIAKVVASNIVKEQEYLFYYFLTLTGMDVLLLQLSGDIGDDLKKYGFSVEQKVGEFSDIILPPYSVEEPKPSSQQEKKKPAIKTADVTPEIEAQQQENTLPASEHTARKIIIPQERLNRPKAESEHAPKHAPKERREKTYEELANMASSVVMISVNDAVGNVMATGSGIMIGRQGYILTNNHVVAGGRSFSVRIEDDDVIYTTNEVIKYNSVLDLAVIRIRRELVPIPLFDGNDLSRGQKVVAIGSPLGLFNSVSEGIISGFRVIDSVDMIQFTAPISHGSSGGALLNIFGQIIGISTAGIDSGQNINLAVSYKSIGMFVKGFS